ncbi:MAG: segregation/condensation protein A [Nanoarchaeota archaeon]
MLESAMQSNDQIFNILFNSDEITWQNMIYDLVSSESMDPWNLDVSLLAQKFLEKLSKLKDMDLKISGKVLLAAAIMLRVKSYRFLSEDINALDSLIASANEPELGEDLFEEMIDYEEGAVNLKEKPAIYPRTPQPRKRKVSVFDLVNALEKALEVYERRPPKLKSYPDVKIPEKSLDISRVIHEVYKKITDHFSSKGKLAPKLTFNLLLPENTKEDKVFTFIPLLHLDNQRKIDLMQETHLGEIGINLLDMPKV